MYIYISAEQFKIRYKRQPDANEDAAKLHAAQGTQTNQNAH